MKQRFVLSLLLILGTGCSTQKKFQVDPQQLVGQRLEMTSFEMKTTDTDQLQKRVDTLIEEAEAQQKTSPLKQAMRLVLSHTNENATVDKLLPQITSQLVDWNELETQLRELTEEALSRVIARHGESSQQVTYTVILENIVYELNANREDWPFHRQLMQKIANANINLSRKVKNDSQLWIMRNLTSPSQLAQSFLKKYTLEDEKKKMKLLQK